MLEVTELSELEDKEALLNVVNCGFIPSSYKGYWPNVVQFCFFSVLTNTGTTVQLTLQGFIGTFLASVNIWMLYQRLAEDFLQKTLRKTLMKHFEAVFSQDLPQWQPNRMPRWR